MKHLFHSFLKGVSVTLILDEWFWAPAVLWAASVVFGYIFGYEDGQNGARHMGELGRVATNAMIIAMVSGLAGVVQHMRNPEQILLGWPVALWLMAALAAVMIPTLARSAGYARRRRLMARS